MSASDPNLNPTSTGPTPNQDRLKTFFEGEDANVHGVRWDDLWKAGDFLPWDRGFANPALIDTLNSKPEWLGSPLKADGTRKRALVPGCGKGYDIAVLSAYGYDAYGLEISENATRTAQEWLKNPGDGREGEHKVQDEKVGKGVTKIVTGDFFKDDWTEDAGGLGEGFDLIYDCTVSITQEQTLTSIGLTPLPVSLCPSSSPPCALGSPHDPAVGPNRYPDLPRIPHT